ncbi:MAG: hypothetical protein K2M19_02605 [Muribaculaceae bacterium]|nr:hypothetical protein [Muribaculaceae bacterium]
MIRLFLLFLSVLVAGKLVASGDVRVLVDEDFSRMPSGTPEVPWSYPVPVDADGSIAAEYTFQPGWKGIGVHQAGGSCALQTFSDSYGRQMWGRISTPAFYLGGNAEVSLRAKRLPGSRGSVWVSVVTAVDPEPIEIDQFELTTHWNSFRLVVPDIPADEPVRFMISAEGGAVVIDDVLVQFERTDIMAPVGLTLINDSPSSFTAVWDDMNVDDYLVSLYTLGAPDVYESGSLSEGFDLESPEGWEFEGVEISYDSYLCGADVPSVGLGKRGSAVISPVLSLPLTRMECHIVPSDDADEEYGITVLRVDVHRSEADVWESVAYIPASRFRPEGSDIVVGGDAIGRDADRVRLVIADCGDLSLFVDDITLEYASGPTVSYVAEDVVVDQPRVSFSSLSAADDYYLYVKSRDGRLVSGRSREVWFDGIEGVPVTGLQASVVAPGSVELSWDGNPRADAYDVAMFTSITAGGDCLNGCTVLDDEFDDGAEASLWQATNPSWTDGRIGTLGTSVFGIPGLVYSPRVDLSCNGGRGFYVDATVVTTAATWMSQSGQWESEGVQVMVLGDINDLNPLASAVIECPVAGETSARVWVDTEGVGDLKDVIVAFTSLSGCEFYVDRVWVSQTILPGETLFVPLCTPLMTEVPSLRLDGLSTDVDHIIEVTARAMRGQNVYTSLPSARVTAPTNISVSSPVADAAEGKIPLYDICGRPATTSTRLVVTRNGKKIVK